MIHFPEELTDVEIARRRLRWMNSWNCNSNSSRAEKFRGKVECVAVRRRQPADEIVSPRGLVSS